MLNQLELYIKQVTEGVIDKTQPSSITRFNVGGDYISLANLALLYPSLQSQSTYPLNWIGRDADFNFFICITNNASGDTTNTANWKLIISSSGGGGVTGANNGLSVSGGYVQLGGNPLIQDTIIDAAQHVLNINNIERFYIRSNDGDSVSAFLLDSGGEFNYVWTKDETHSFQFITTLTTYQFIAINGTSELEYQLTAFDGIQISHTGASTSFALQGTDNGYSYTNTDSDANVSLFKFGTDEDGDFFSWAWNNSDSSITTALQVQSTQFLYTGITPTVGDNPSVNLYMQLSSAGAYLNYSGGVGDSFQIQATNISQSRTSYAPDLVSSIAETITLDQYQLLSYNQVTIATKAGSPVSILTGGNDGDQVQILVNDGSGAVIVGDYTCVGNQDPTTLAANLASTFSGVLGITLNTWAGFGFQMLAPTTGITANGWAVTYTVTGSITVSVADFSGGTANTNYTDNYEDTHNQQVVRLQGTENVVFNGFDEVYQNTYESQLFSNALYVSCTTYEEVVGTVKINSYSQAYTPTQFALTGSLWKVVDGNAENDTYSFNWSSQEIGCGGTFNKDVDGSNQTDLYTFQVGGNEADFSGTFNKDVNGTNQADTYDSVMQAQNYNLTSSFYKYLDDSATTQFDGYTSYIQGFNNNLYGSFWKDALGSPVVDLWEMYQESDYSMLSGTFYDTGTGDPNSWYFVASTTGIFAQLDGVDNFQLGSNLTLAYTDANGVSQMVPGIVSQIQIYCASLTNHSIIIPVGRGGTGNEGALFESKADRHIDGDTSMSYFIIKSSNPMDDQFIVWQRFESLLDMAA